MTFHRNIFYDYPVARLPDDLRDGFNPDALVKITIEDTFELRSGMLVVERTFQFQNGAIVKIGERSYTAL